MGGVRSSAATMRHHRGVCHNGKKAKTKSLGCAVAVQLTGERRLTDGRQLTSEQVAKDYFTYVSSDGDTAVQAVFWVNDRIRAGQLPRAIVQIIHGMGEHIGRYERFATFLATQGYLVCGNDAVGHGKTALAPEEFGVLPGKNPVDVLVRDVDSLRRAVEPGAAAAFDGQQLPYFMFGHSMGSLVLRCYLPRFGAGLAGAVVCGTTMPPRFMSWLGMMASRALICLKGPTAKSPFLHKMAYGVYSNKIKNARTPFDWISSDPAEVDEFIRDEATGFMFSAAVYLALTEAAYDAACRPAFRGIPPELPILLISGDEDPVGGCGRQVERVAARMRAGGVKSVTVKLYGGMRHEILNEYGRGEVFSDVVSWMEEVEDERAARDH